MENEDLSVLQQGALERLQQYQKMHEETEDGWWILLAVRVCASNDLKMPDWLSRAYCRRFDQVLNARMKSWDDAFDRPYEKGVHLSRKRADRINRPTV